MSATPSLAEFWDRLKRFDWDYERSDDPGVYARGQAEMKSMQESARCGRSEQQLLWQFERHHRSAYYQGREFANREWPLPERPKL